MGCAFTQKVYKMCIMLLHLGHEVFLYGAEGSDAPCTDFIQTHTLAEIRQQWGDEENDENELGYDWQNQDFRHDINGDLSPLSKEIFQRQIAGINGRKKPDDFLLISQGYYQKDVADAVDLYLTCEPGIGYRGSWARFKAFESTYIMNFTYGSRAPYQSVDGFWYDRVIPNYFDPDDFKPAKSVSNYYLYIGRMIPRKGIDVALKTCEALGARLVLAGQGTFPTEYAKAEFFGYADAEARKKLMGAAIATFVPTLYLEPFGGVAVESMLSGTPVLTTDWGAFQDTVTSGVTGFRCHTLQDFVQAALLAKELNRTLIREIAVHRWSMYNVAQQYQKWFDDLYQLYLSAIYTGVQGWHHLPQRSQ